MTRNARQALISLVMVVVMAICLLITLPIAQRHSEARTAQVVANHRGSAGTMATNVIQGAMIPSLVAVFASACAGALAGFLVARKLPRAEPTRMRHRRQR